MEYLLIFWDSVSFICLVRHTGTPSGTPVPSLANWHATGCHPKIPGAPSLFQGAATHYTAT